MQADFANMENDFFKNDVLTLGDLTLSSRIIVGTGKYSSLDLMRQCHAQSNTQMVTVALRRVSSDVCGKNILDYIDTSCIRLLPNTAGCQSAQETLRLAKLAKSMGMTHLKIEVMGDVKTLLPDPIETLKSVELIREQLGDSLFLMVYTSSDPILADKLIKARADAVMPAGSPIGSGRGMENPYGLKLLLEIIDGRVPVILDAGIGSPADAALAMEMGFDAILLNTAIAAAGDPVQMARSMRMAWMAGRMSYLAGRMDKKMYATASSPILDF